MLALASAGIFAPTILSGCDDNDNNTKEHALALAAEVIVAVSAFSFREVARELALALIVEHMVFEGEKLIPSVTSPAIADRPQDSPEARQLAALVDGDQIWARSLVSVIGKEEARKIITGETRSWCQQDHTGKNINRYSVDIKNNTDHEVQGNLKLALDDFTTGTRHFTWRTNGYKLFPNGSIHYIGYCIDVTSSGLKKMSVIAHPEHVTTNADKVFVAPLRSTLRTI